MVGSGHGDYSRPFGGLSMSNQVLATVAVDSFEAACFPRFRLFG